MYDFREYSVKDYYDQSDRFVLIDVRSEGEFEEDHIQGSFNVPILRNEERRLVGIAYKEKGVKEAKRLGRNLLLPRIRDFLDTIEEIRDREKKKPLVYCARGGERSALAGTFLAMESQEVYRLQGGYKAYRGYVLDYFKNRFDKEIKTFYGLTGSGKTEVLLQMAGLGLPVVDLEGLANNRGSVFGHIGLGAQPSQKRFDSQLFEACRRIEGDFLIVEGESKKIGRLYIPDGFYDKMISGDSYLIECSLDSRVQRIIREYGGYLLENEGEIIRAIDYLKINLGKARTDELLALFKEKKLDRVVSFLLTDYYDVLYEKNRKMNQGYLKTYNSDQVEECAVNISKDFN